MKAIDLFNKLKTSEDQDIIYPENYRINYKGYSRKVKSVTRNKINLMSSKEEYQVQFYKDFDKGLELCHKALLLRDNYCKKIQAKNSPLLWRYGAYLREKDPNKTLGEMMKEHPLYNTISLGFVGLYETSMALLNKSNTTKEGQELCINIMKHMNEKVEGWKTQAREGSVEELKEDSFEID